MMFNKVVVFLRRANGCGPEFQTQLNSRCKGTISNQVLDLPARRGIREGATRDTISAFDYSSSYPTSKIVRLKRS